MSAENHRYSDVLASPSDSLLKDRPTINFQPMTYGMQNMPLALQCKDL